MEKARAFWFWKERVSATEVSISTIAYFSGYGLMTDLHHFTAPHPEGEAISETIDMALKDAGVEPGEIDYVNAHGTATVLNDIAETKGLKKTFGSHAKKISISSIKSMIGHTLGAASIFESIATALSLNHELVPPTAHLTATRSGMRSGLYTCCAEKKKT